MKKPKRVPTKGTFIRNEVYFSEAHLTLHRSSMHLLHCLLVELNALISKSKYGDRVSFPNNGSVSYTEVQFKAEFGYSSRTYISARNQLIKVGFIKQINRGGLGPGDRATYKILCTQDLTKAEQRWREYPDKNWAHEIPKAKGQTVGKKTQWRKGQSGRKKSKSTLPQYTLNAINSPTGVPPYDR